VVSLDFKALEARIVLAEAGKYSAEEDIYNEISQKQFNGVLPRDVVKTAVLADLYGISRGALKARLGVSDQKLDAFMSVIRDYFKVESLRQRLKDQVGTSGKMLNRFGRPLNIPEGQDNLLVNSYAQSSGVDVAMIGFDSVLKRLGSDGIRPLFVLHDAIILDVHPNRLTDVRECTSVDITTYEKPFPLKFESLRDS
jgi:DNA polymerase I-like protein with 3'-5' exonuclease and polymerase domains